MKKVVVVGAVIAVLVGLWFFLHHGVTVEVRNVGNEQMRAVIVHVTGNSYPIGDLPAGSSRRVDVSATSESHVELEYQGHDRLIIDCYFEPGYKGTITAQVTALKVVSVNDSVRIGTPY